VSADKILPSTSVQPPVTAGPQIVYDSRSKLRTGKQVEPKALEAQVWGVQEVVSLAVEIYQSQAFDLALQAIQSLSASLQAAINLHVPKLKDKYFGVKTHTPSEPPPLQAI